MSSGSYSATSSAGVALPDGSGSLADLDCRPAASADAPLFPETLVFLFREFSDTTRKVQEAYSHSRGQGAERVVKSPLTLSAPRRECVISEQSGAEIAPLFFHVAESTSSDKRASTTKRALPLDLWPVRGDGMSFAIALSNAVGVEA